MGASSTFYLRCFILFFAGSAFALASGDHDVGLQEAAKRGDLRIYKMMLGLGARPHTVDKSGNNAVLMAVYGGNRLILRDLLERRVDVNAKGSIGMTPLGLAVVRGDVDVVKLLLKAGADVNLKDDVGFTPLLAAIDLERMALIETLIKVGADVNLADAEGRTPLMTAAAKGMRELVPVLIARGAWLDARDREGRTPLFWSIFEGHSGVATELIEAGAERRRPIKGYSPLHWASVMQRKEVVSMLER